MGPITNPKALKSVFKHQHPRLSTSSAASSQKAPSHGSGAAEDGASPGQEAAARPQAPPWEKLLLESCGSPPALVDARGFLRIWSAALRESEQGCTAGDHGEADSQEDEDSDEDLLWVLRVVLGPDIYDAGVTAEAVLPCCDVFWSHRHRVAASVPAKISASDRAVLDRLLPPQAAAVPKLVHKTIWQQISGRTRSVELSEATASTSAALCAATASQMRQPCAGKEELLAAFRAVLLAGSGGAAGRAEEVPFMQLFNVVWQRKANVAVLTKLVTEARKERSVEDATLDSAKKVVEETATVVVGKAEEERGEAEAQQRKAWLVEEKTRLREERRAREQQTKQAEEDERARKAEELRRREAEEQRRREEEAWRAEEERLRREEEEDRARQEESLRRKEAEEARRNRERGDAASNAARQEVQRLRGERLAFEEVERAGREEELQAEEEHRKQEDAEQARREEELQLKEEESRRAEREDLRLADAEQIRREEELRAEEERLKRQDAERARREEELRRREEDLRRREEEARRAEERLKRQEEEQAKREEEERRLPAERRRMVEQAEGVEADRRTIDEEAISQQDSRRVDGLASGEVRTRSRKNVRQEVTRRKAAAGFTPLRPASRRSSTRDIEDKAVEVDGAVPSPRGAEPTEAAAGEPPQEESGGLSSLWGLASAAGEALGQAAGAVTQEEEGKPTREERPSQDKTANPVILADELPAPTLGALRRADSLDSLDEVADHSFRRGFAAAAAATLATAEATAPAASSPQAGVAQGTLPSGIDAGSWIAEPRGLRPKRTSDLGLIRLLEGPRPSVAQTSDNALQFLKDEEPVLRAITLAQPPSWSGLPSSAPCPATPLMPSGIADDAFRRLLYVEDQPALHWIAAEMRNTPLPPGVRLLDPRSPELAGRVVTGHAPCVPPPVIFELPPRRDGEERELSCQHPYHEAFEHAVSLAILLERSTQPAVLLDAAEEVWTEQYASMVAAWRDSPTGGFIHAETGERSATDPRRRLWSELQLGCRLVASLRSRAGLRPGLRTSGRALATSGGGGGGGNNGGYNLPSGHGAAAVDSRHGSIGSAWPSTAGVTF